MRRLLRLGLLVATLVLLTSTFVIAAAGDPSVYEKTNINWRQAAGESIVVAMNLHMETTALQAQLPEFEKLTGIKVHFQVYPELELHQKSLVDLASKAGIFDVIMQDYMFTPQYAIANFIEPLDPYLNNPKLTDSKWFNSGDFNPALWKAVQWKGTVYALPFTSESTCLFYRKDLLAEKGIKVPTNYDELMEAAKKLNSPPDVYGIGMRGLRGQGMNIYVWTGFLKGFGGDFFKDFPEDMTPVLDSKAAIEATRYYATILQKYGPPGAANWSWMEVMNALQQGRIAMAIDASNFGPHIDATEKSKTAGKWGYAVVPGGSGGRHPAIYTHTLSMNANSKHKTAAWLFMQWATSYPAQYERAMETGEPTRVSIWKDAEFQKKMAYVGNGQWTKVSLESLGMASADYRPRFKEWRQIGDRIGIAVQAVIANELKPEDAMKAAQRDIESILQKAGYKIK